MGDKDRLRKRLMKKLDSTQSANIISDKDLKILEESTKKLDSTQSANIISDKDLKILEEAYIKRNDGGMAMSGRGKPVRTF